MATPGEAGSVSVKVLPNPSKAEWEEQLNAFAEQITVSVKVNLKLSKTAVSDLVKDTQVAFDKRKALPKLPVKFKIAKGAVTEIVTTTQTAFDKRNALPRLPVKLKLVKGAVASAAKDAEAQLLAAKKAQPTIKVNLDLDADELKLIKEARIKVREVDAALRVSGERIDIPLDLDEKSLKRVGEKAAAAYAVMQKRIDAEFDKREELKAVAEAKRTGTLLANDLQFLRMQEEWRADLLEKGRDKELLNEESQNRRLFEKEQDHQNKLNNLLRENLDARSMEELKQANKVALLHERAELAQRSSSITTLRRLRNDLSQFDQTTTRFLRRASIGFGLFTAGIVASFTAIGIASLKSFADTEKQLRRTAAVLGTDAFSEKIAELSDAGVTGVKAQEQAFASFRKEAERTNEALQETVNLTSLGTVFDQTEIATGARALAQAGLQIGEINESLLGISQFAQNEEILPEEAVQNLVQGATAAGESLGRLRQLADQFTFVANNTTASATEVAAAFSNRAAPAFRAYGEEVSATLTVLDLFAASGIKGKTAGEQAGILIREINKAATKTPATTAAFKKYGIEIGKVNGVQVPFLKTLGQLGTVLDNVRTQKGSQELARIRKELGLTEKSGAGLLQLLPQITAEADGSADKAYKNLANIQKQIEGSTAGVGATARQASFLTDSLSFQTELLGNQITSLFRAAAAPGGKALTKVFNDLNGEIGMVNGKITQTGGVVAGLQDKFIAVGKKLAKEIVPSIQRFATGGEGEDFFRGLFVLYKGFLGGLKDAFGEFRREVFGEGSNKGFFSVMGAGFAALGRFAADALPRIGRGLGTIIGFIKDNQKTVELFVKAWLGLFLASKALRLFIIPVAGLTTQITSLTSSLTILKGLQVTQWAVSATTAMTGLTAATTANAIATDAVVAAQSRLVLASAAQAARRRPFETFRKSRPIDSTTILANSAAADKTYARNLALAASFQKATGSISKFYKEIGGVKGALKGVGLYIAPLIYFAGVLKGAIDQLNAELGGDGNVSLRDFGNAIRFVTNAIGAVLGPIFSFLSGITKIIFGFGKMGGGALIIVIAGAIRSMGSALAWTAGKVQDFGKWISELLDKIPGASSAVDKFSGAIRGVGDAIDWTFEKIKLLPEAFGAGFDSLADSTRMMYGENNVLSAGYQDVASALGYTDAKGRTLTATLRMLQAQTERMRGDAIENLADKWRLLGVANEAMIPKYLKLTAAQKALGHSQKSAAEFASIQQKRQAMLAYTSDLLAGKVKNATDMQTLMSRSSAVASKNLLRLVGGEDQLQKMLAEVASGNKRAAKTFMDYATTSQRLAIAKAKTVIKSLRAEMAVTAASAQQNMYASTVNGRVARRIEVNQKFMQENLSFVEETQKLVDSLMANNEVGEIPEIAGAAGTASAAIAEVKTAADAATEAVDKLTVAQFKSAAQGLINKIAKLPGTYKATAYEAALLGKAMPSIDKAIQSQTEAVTKLDEALQGLQATQLLGTKAASDEAFASEQQVKQLELQKLDLKIAGVVDDDPAVKAIDEQIAAIQLRAERAALAASIGLDPLKKKLEETFTPVKELSFDAIIAQFSKLNAERTKAQGNLTKTETLKAKLDEIVAASADKFAGVGLSVSQGIVAGTTAGKPAVAKAGKDTANTLVVSTKKQLGIQSPSTVMATIGLQSSQGYALGILSGRPAVVAASDAIRIAAVNSLLVGVPFFRAAGVRSLAGFKEGMQSVWKTSGSWGNSLQEFVLGIATWIQKNKGPISYDAQLLRPAGEAIMSGFKRGLNDGFGEVKAWVGKVGPSIGDDFPKELMFERSAKFLLNNYKADTTFSPDDAFSDLISESYTPGGEGPSGLSFLHKTKSYADTMKMAEMIAKKYGMSITGRGESAGHVVGSQHPKGQAADISNSAGSDWNRSSRTPEMERMKNDLLPYLSKYLHQVIYAEKIYGSGGGATGAGGSITNSNPHNAHVHVGWQPDGDFSRNSGKLGSYGLDIPGVPQDVMEAINYAAEKTKLDARLIAAVMKQESGYRKDAVSFDGGYGLMQLTSAGLVAQAKSMGNIFDPKVNTLVGAKYLSDLINQLGSRKLGLSAYNSGPGGGERYGRVDVPDYVRKVLAHLDEIIRKTGGSGIGNFRAMGGNVNAKTPYVVGERGREVFIPDRSGTVISNKNVEGLIRMAQEGRMTGGAGTIINDNRVNHIQSNSTDNAAVAALVDAKLRAQLVGVRR